MSYFKVNQSQGTRVGTVILHPAGPLNTNVLPDFHAATMGVTAPRIVVDLGAVPHMDSAGLGALLILHTALAKEGRTLALANPEKRVKTLIALTKADTVLAVYPTIQAAEESLA